MIDLIIKTTSSTGGFDLEIYCRNILALLMLWKDEHRY